jgi:hypothetical protein
VRVRVRVGGHLVGLADPDEDDGLAGLVDHRERGADLTVHPPL